MFIIYINDLSDSLASNPNLSEDDTSLFFGVYDLTTTAENLNNDSNKIKNCAFQWKTNFIPDFSKQTQEVVFTRKNIKRDHPQLLFNNNPVIQTNMQKHLGKLLDTKLNFNDHLKIDFAKKQIKQ